jgi:type IV secretion system protein VirD4
MKWIISVLAIVLMMAGVIVFGLYNQYGGFDLIPPYDTIISQLKAQNLKSPKTWMQLSAYIIIAASLPLFLIGAMLTYRARDEYGSAHWASEGEIKKAGLRAKEGVILGISGGRYIRSAKPLSTLCVAPPGTGKTAAVVIPNALAYEGSIVALDIKGEISQKTAPYRSTVGDVLIFDPASKDNKVGFNPFGKAMLPEDWNGSVALVYQVAELIFQSRSKNDEHWILEAKNMFAFFALYLIKTKGETSLPAIRAYAMSFPALQDEIKKLLEENDDLPLQVIQLGNALIQKAYNEFSGVFSTFQTKLLVFVDEYVAQSFSRNSFTPDELRQRRITLYFRLTEIDAERLAPCVRLFLDFLVKRLFGREKQTGDQNVLFLLDEFPRFGRVPILVKLPALGRSYGLLAMYFFQSNGQITEIYEKSGLEELDASTAYKILLTQNEYSTAKAYSDSIGQYTRVKKGKSTSLNDNLKESRSSNYSIEGTPLVRPEDLMSMPSDQAIVIFQSSRKTPIKVKPAYWFKDRQMKRAVDG